MIFHSRLFRWTLLFPLGIILLAASPYSFATEEDAGSVQGFFDAELGVGYKAVSTEGEPGRAKEYSFLRSSAIGSVDMHAWKEMRSYSLLADYENEADYRAELAFNNRGKVRLWLITESMFHNLDHFPFDDANRPDAFKSATNRWVNFEDLNAGDEYFVELERNNARLRVKAGNYPAHLNLEYWRLERSGREQLRYVDHGSDDLASAGNCNECHVRSQSRTLDRVTEEVKGSIDAHLGYVDIIAEQLYREFRDREPIPFDSFGSTARFAAGDFQHDEDPDSRLISSTVKLHTSLSGGVSGAASFTIGKRENQSELVDVREVRSETDFRKGAADVTWILSPRWTFNFRYRLLDLDNSNSNLLVSSSEADPIVLIRNNVDLTRATYLGRIAYRPNRDWTLKGEFERKEIHRGNVGTATLDDPDPVWELPKDEEIHRVRVTAIGRPAGTRQLKLNAWYEYLTSDDPAYGTSAEESREGFGGLTWNPTPRFGLNASFRVLEQFNKNHAFTQHSHNFGTDDTLHFFEEDRRHEKTDFIVGSWWNPAEALTLTFNYGFLRTRTVQDLIFSSNAFSGHFVQDDDLENSQRVHTASAGVNLRILESLVARLEGRYIRTFANWDPRFSLEAPSGVPVDSEGLDETTRLDILQAGASLGLDWSPTESWTCSLRYTFDDYEDRDNSVFDGTVQTYMASVSRFW